jgi:hypothetical protein
MDETIYAVHQRTEGSDGWNVVLRKDGPERQTELEAGDLMVRVRDPKAGERFTIGRRVAVGLRFLDSP